MKILLLNGPPGCGKDFAAELIRSHIPSTTLHKFARVLKERTHALYGVGDRPHDHYEQCKDEPHADFLGLTPREAYIGVSERYFKPVHGEQVFGKLLAPELARPQVGYGLRVISDSGFLPEAEYLREHFGAHAVKLVSIQRDGTNFDNDSRSYWTWEGVGAPPRVYNNTTADDLYRQLQSACGWL